MATAYTFNPCAEINIPEAGTCTGISYSQAEILLKHSISVYITTNTEFVKLTKLADLAEYSNTFNVHLFDSEEDAIRDIMNTLSQRITNAKQIVEMYKYYIEKYPEYAI